MMEPLRKELFKESLFWFKHRPPRLMNPFSEEQKKRLCELFVVIKKNAKMGLAEFEYNLALCYKYGAGTEVCHKKALKYFKRADEKDFVEATKELGDFYHHNNFDLETAKQFYERAALHLNCPEMLYILGERSYFGQGVPICLSLAAKHFKSAAIQGHSQAHYALSKIYFSGKKGEIKVEKALNHLYASAELENVNAIIKLGKLCLRGSLFPKNELQAYRYFKCAKKLGSKVALYELAKMHMEGIGVEVNYKKSF